jgi:hypothetical protein
MRIDFALCSPALGRRVTGALIDREHVDLADCATPGPRDDGSAEPSLSTASR